MEMFCYQCEQTTFGKGCTKRGVCEKTPKTVNDKLINSLIELANCNQRNETNTKLAELPKAAEKDFYPGGIIPEAEANAYNSMAKIYPCPLKIWHCMDDTTVLYRYSQFMVNMIKNGGGIADLTTYETGGHLGGWTHGEVVDEGVTTTEPFYEAIKFFKSFI